MTSPITKLKKKADKEYVFRHMRAIKFPPSTISEEEAKNKLIESELARGYIPINVRFEKIKYQHHLSVEPVQFDQAYCYSAYAGKKSARELFKTLSADKLIGDVGVVIKPYSNSYEKT